MAPVPGTTGTSEHGRPVTWRPFAPITWRGGHSEGRNRSTVTADTTQGGQGGREAEAIGAQFRHRPPRWPAPNPGPAPENSPTTRPWKAFNTAHRCEEASSYGAGFLSPDTRAAGHARSSLSSATGVGRAAL